MGGEQAGAASVRHVPALDGVRGLAILWVVLHNSHRYAPHARGLLKPLAILTDAGWMGVTLFFALSGFLITGILLDTRDAPNRLRAFYARRVLRIFPLYYAALVVGLLLWPRLAPAAARGSTDGAAWLWAYVFNWFVAYGGSAGVFSQFWSLSVEEQFYLVWPAVLTPFSAAGVARLSLLVAAASLGWRLWLHGHGATPAMLYNLTASRVDALAFGAAGAAVLRVPAWRARVAAWGPRLLPIAAVLLVAAAVPTRLFTIYGAATQTWGYTILGAAAAALVVAAGAVDGPAARVLSARWLRTLGTYSYGMYVLHLPISLACDRALPSLRGVLGDWSAPAFGVLVVLVTLAAAVPTYHLFEMRFLALKRHFVPRRAGAAATA